MMKDGTARCEELNHIPITFYGTTETTKKFLGLVVRKIYVCNTAYALKIENHRLYS